MPAEPSAFGVPVSPNLISALGVPSGVGGRHCTAERSTAGPGFRFGTVVDQRLDVSVQYRLERCSRKRPVSGVAGRRAGQVAGDPLVQRWVAEFFVWLGQQVVDPEGGARGLDIAVGAEGEQGRHRVLRMHQRSTGDPVPQHGDDRLVDLDLLGVQGTQDLVGPGLQVSTQGKVITADQIRPVRQGLGLPEPQGDALPEGGVGAASLRSPATRPRTTHHHRSRRDAFSRARGLLRAPHDVRLLRAPHDGDQRSRRRP